MMMKRKKKKNNLPGERVALHSSSLFWTAKEEDMLLGLLGLLGEDDAVVADELKRLLRKEGGMDGGGAMRKGEMDG